METLKTLVNELKNDKETRRADREAWKVRGLTKPDYIKCVKYFGNYYCDIKSAKSTFSFDSFNMPVIEQFYYYLMGDSQNCKLDVNRGIFLMGAIGTGKTVLMNALLDLQDYLTRHHTTKMNSKDIIESISYNGIGRYKFCPLFIDDVGRENLEDVDWGKRIKPFTDLIATRYEAGSLTFATSNYSLETLSGTSERKGYGEYVTSRMRDMFNLIELRGDNRRKTVRYETK